MNPGSIRHECECDWAEHEWGVEGEAVSLYQYIFLSNGTRARLDSGLPSKTAVAAGGSLAHIAAYTHPVLCRCALGGMVLMVTPFNPLANQQSSSASTSS